jgi:hypothetical protein
MMIEDTRQRADGTPLRVSEEFMYLQMQNHKTLAPEDLPEYIYESQLSLMVTGIDDWVWAGYCFVDVYFKGERHSEQVEHYLNAQTKMDPLMDPLCCGKYPADPPIWIRANIFFGHSLLECNK